MAVTWRAFRLGLERGAAIDLDGLDLDTSFAPKADATAASFERLAVNGDVDEPRASGRRLIGF